MATFVEGRTQGESVGNGVLECAVGEGDGANIDLLNPYKFMEI